MKEYLNKVMLSYGAAPEPVEQTGGLLLRLIRARASEEQFKQLHHKIKGMTRLLKLVPGEAGSPEEEFARCAQLLADDGLNPPRVAQTLRMFGEFYRQRVADEPELLALIDGWQPLA